VAALDSESLSSLPRRLELPGQVGPTVPRLTEQASQSLACQVSERC
jgi:hypothetical protein